MTFVKHVKAAGRQATSSLTRDLRAYLEASGWTAEAASAVSVSYTELDGFTVKIRGQHKQAAENFEYGTEVMRPTAAIRKYFNDQVNLETIYQKALESALGMKI